MPIEDTYSPIVHRINQAIKRRAVRPDEPVPPPADILIKYSHSPKELVKKSEAHLSKLVAAANLKKGMHYSNSGNITLIMYSPTQSQGKAWQGSH